MELAGLQGDAAAGGKGSLEDSEKPAQPVCVGVCVVCVCGSH